MTELKQGTTLQGGKYTIVKKLGSGSFGITYLATMLASVEGSIGKINVEVKVAIKEFFMQDLNHRAIDGRSVGRTNSSIAVNYLHKFQKEAENLAKLNHRNIVRVLEVFAENNTAYYVMELIDGITLDEYIMRRGRLPENEALMILQRLCSAIGHMHEHRMLHLDIKPKNIMMDKSYHIYLIDFGLSKQYTDNGEPESSTTIGLGTPGYAPLEQANYKQDGSFPATMDVYALGATLFKMLVGQTPPDASTVLNDGLPVDRLKQLGVSVASIAQLEKAMAPMRKMRYQSVNELCYDMTGNPNEENTVITEEHVIIEDTTTIDTISLEDDYTQEVFIDLGVSVKWSRNNWGAENNTSCGHLVKGVEINNPNQWESVPNNFGGTMYDPVTNDMGKEYRLPTQKEWRELINKCEWQWTTIDGHNGYLITGNNGKSIFLPFSSGYWSCTKGESKDFQCLYYLYINSYDIDLVYNVFTTLRCIRPVQAK